MAKTEARKLAYIYFVEHKLTQKEAADKAGVSTNTMSKWVNAGKWTEKRDALIFSANEQVKNIREVIGCLAEETVELAKSLRACDKKRDKETAMGIRVAMNSVADQAAKWRKTLEDIEKDKVSLSVYLMVMEDVFKVMHANHPHIYHQLIDFQEELIHKKAVELG